MQTNWKLYIWQTESVLKEFEYGYQGSRTWLTRAQVLKWRDVGRVTSHLFDHFRSSTSSATVSWISTLRRGSTVTRVRLRLTEPQVKLPPAPLPGGPWARAAGNGVELPKETVEVVGPTTLKNDWVTCSEVRAGGTRKAGECRPGVRQARPWTAESVRRTTRRSTVTELPI